MEIKGKTLEASEGKKLAFWLGLAILLVSMCAQAAWTEVYFFSVASFQQLTDWEYFAFHPFQKLAMLPIALFVDQKVGRRAAISWGAGLVAAGFGILFIYEAMGSWILCAGFAAFMPSAVAAFSKAVSFKIGRRDGGFALAVVLYLLGDKISSLYTSFILNWDFAAPAELMVVALCIPMLFLAHRFNKMPKELFLENGAFLRKGVDTASTIGLLVILFVCFMVVWGIGYSFFDGFDLNTYFVSVLSLVTGLGFLIAGLVKGRREKRSLGVLLLIFLLALGHSFVSGWNNVFVQNVDSDFLADYSSIDSLSSPYFHWLVIAVAISAMFFLKERLRGDLGLLVRTGVSLLVLALSAWAFFGFMNEDPSAPLPWFPNSISSGLVWVFGFPMLLVLIWKHGPTQYKTTAVAFAFVAESMGGFLFNLVVDPLDSTAEFAYEAEQVAVVVGLVVLATLVVLEIRRQQRKG